MVTAPHHLASAAGLEVLQAGGNAAEAAVATAAALAVVYPHMNSIGGDSFWLMKRMGEPPVAIDACGRAASAAQPSLYVQAGYRTIPRRGPLAANTVAGTISGWAELLALSGSKLPLNVILENARRMAEHGVTVTRGLEETVAGAATELAHFSGFAATFLPGGAPLRAGTKLHQPALAQTLSRLAEEGLESFYRGALADDLAADLSAFGSPVSKEDLASHRSSQVSPLSTRLRDAQIFNLPPPTQGVASLLILALFDRLACQEADGFEHVHGLVEATKLAFRVRNAHVGDPDANRWSPQGLLDDVALLDGKAREINSCRAAPWPHPPQPGDTVWFGVVDADGCAVSAIQSTYFEFGSGLVLPRTGIVWQNRGCSFSLDEAGPNQLRPRAKPFHTLNPALAQFDDGRTMVYGTMGGEGQPQTQAALFTRYARFGMDLQASVSAPRWLLGRTWGDEATNLKIEDRFPAGLIDALRAAGHDVETVPSWTSLMGHAGAIVRLPSGELEGATDPRSDGAVAAF